MEGSKHEGKTYKGKLNIDGSYIHLCQDVHSASNIARNIYGFAYSYAFSSTKNLKDEISLSVFKNVKFKKKSGPIASIDASTADNWFQPKDWNEFEDGMEFRIKDDSTIFGKISLEKYEKESNLSVFFCTDKLDGANCKDKKGFKRSYIVYTPIESRVRGANFSRLNNIELKRLSHKEQIVNNISAPSPSKDAVHLSDVINLTTSSNVIENPKFKDYEDGDDFEAQNINYPEIKNIRGKISIDKSGSYEKHIFLCHNDNIYGVTAQDLKGYKGSQGLYKDNGNRWDGGYWSNIKLFKKNIVGDNIHPTGLGLGVIDTLKNVLSEEDQISIKTSKVKGNVVIPTNDYDKITIKTNKIYGKVNSSEVQGPNLSIKRSTRSGRAGSIG
jgi:hypothetical protein